jgi:hypothetical protein
VIEVIPATRRHAERIKLRRGDAREIAVLGLTMPEAFDVSTRRALWTHTYLIDGEIGAIVGLSINNLLSGWASPWLVTGEPVNRHRKEFLRLTREGVERMKAFRRLQNWVHAEYTETIRWLRWLGFEIGSPVPKGPFAAPFCLFTMEQS